MAFRSAEHTQEKGLVKVRMAPGKLRLFSSFLAGMGLLAGCVAREGTIGAMLGQHAKLDLTHIPYRGAPPMLQDALSGQVAVAVTTVTDSLPHIQGGKLRAVAVSGKDRSKYLPDVPTFAEQGAADIVVEDWFGMFVPAKTPMPIVEQLNTAISKALASPLVRDRLTQLAYIPAGGSQGEFVKRLRTDIDKWSPVVKSTGFKIEE